MLGALARWPAFCNIGTVAAQHIAHLTFLFFTEEKKMGGAPDSVG